jgi:ComF family protein
MVNLWTQRLIPLLFPARCVLCGAPGEQDLDLCAECLRQLPWIEHRCDRCAIPLPQNGICGACLQHPPQFDYCLAPLRYEGTASELITGLKFHQQLGSARLLAALLSRFLQQQGAERPQWILPVPLHPSRLRERGFNQSLELARYLARATGCALSTHHCQRVRPTAPQSTLPKRERRRNLRGAFRLVRPLDCRHLALVDDVVTTGSTVNELSLVLKQAGVERVDVWCLARTP